MTSKYTFGNFYAHGGNRVALLAAKKIVEFPGEIFNPFYVYGVEGSGKTHLLNALNDELSKKFATNFLPVREFEKYLREESIFDAPLIIDDIHAIRDDFKKRLEQVVERAVSADIQVCFAADVAPQQIKDFSPRLCSLIESGLISELSLPGLSDRIDMIKKKAEDNGIIIPDDFAEALAQTVTGSINMISKVVSRLVTYASLGNLPTDIDSVRSLLNEFYPKDKVCPVPTVIDKMRRNDLFELKSSEKDDLRAEYDEKTHIWELKGLDVSYLRERASYDEAQLRDTYNDYVERVRRLFELQGLFHDQKDELGRAEAMEIESMLFDPRKIVEIEKLLGATAQPAERTSKVDSLVVSLGLPGEEIPEQMEPHDSGRSAEARGPAPSMVIREPEPVDISSEQHFMIPDVQAELIEENF